MNIQTDPATILAEPDRSWKGALTLIKADLRRRLELEERPVNLLTALSLLFTRGGLAVAAYRVSTWLHGNDRVLLARLVELQYFYTGIELQVGSRIGPGLVLRDQKGIGVHYLVTIGKNCTILGASSLTLGGVENVDPTRDRAIVGDHCVIGMGTRLVGAVTIADGTQVKPNSVILVSSLVPGSILSGIPARRRGTVPLAAAVEWNPLRSRLRRSSVGRPIDRPRRNTVDAASHPAPVVFDETT